MTNLKRWQKVQKKICCQHSSTVQPPCFPWEEFETVKCQKCTKIQATIERYMLGTAHTREVYLARLQHRQPRFTRVKFRFHAAKHANNAWGTTI